MLQLDRMHAIPVGLKPVWDKDFLELLYDTITQKKAEQFGNEVFNRVERTFCCGLQSSDPAVRKKVGCCALRCTPCHPSAHSPGWSSLSVLASMQFFRLYAERVPPNLFDRLRYIIQVRSAPPRPLMD